MSYNLPDGCTESDIDRAYEGKPMSEAQAKIWATATVCCAKLDELLNDPLALAEFIKNNLRIQDVILEELEQTITNEEIEGELRENWDYVQRGRESGYVPK